MRFVNDHPRSGWLYYTSLHLTLTVDVACVSRGRSGPLLWHSCAELAQRSHFTLTSTRAAQMPPQPVNAMILASTRMGDDVFNHREIMVHVGFVRGDPSISRHARGQLPKKYWGDVQHNTVQYCLLHQVRPSSLNERTPPPASITI